MGRTSLSDHASYRSFCSLAAADDEVFRRFRSTHRSYSDVLEHVSGTLALEYASHLRLPETATEVELKLATTDRVGTPLEIQVPGVGSVTGSVLRYLSVARDIQALPGVHAESHFLEVGVGYGGQVRVLANLFPGASFTLVDLPETLNLARRFLEASRVEADISYVAASAVRPVESDVFISNYALSELRRRVQNMYLSNFVSRSRSGYVTWNAISPRSYRSMTIEDLVSRVGGVVAPESPLSYPGNVVIRWWNA